MAEEERLSYDESEDGISEEFESFIVGCEEARVVVWLLGLQLLVLQLLVDQRASGSGHREATRVL